QHHFDPPKRGGRVDPPQAQPRPARKGRTGRRADRLHDLHVVPNRSHRTNTSFQRRAKSSLSRQTTVNTPGRSTRVRPGSSEPSTCTAVTIRYRRRTMETIARSAVDRSPVATPSDTADRPGTIELSAASPG